MYSTRLSVFITDSESKKFVKLINVRMNTEGESVVVAGETIDALEYISRAMSDNNIVRASKVTCVVRYDNGKYAPRYDQYVYGDVVLKEGKAICTKPYLYPFTSSVTEREFWFQ